MRVKGVMARKLLCSRQIPVLRLVYVTACERLHCFLLFVSDNIVEETKKYRSTLKASQFCIWNRPGAEDYRKWAMIGVLREVTTGSQSLVAYNSMTIERPCYICIYFLSNAERTRDEKYIKLIFTTDCVKQDGF